MHRCMFREKYAYTYQNIVGHHEKSLCSHNDMQRCACKLRIIPSDWIMLLCGLLMLSTYPDCWGGELHCILGRDVWKLDAKKDQHFQQVTLPNFKTKKIKCVLWPVPCFKMSLNPVWKHDVKCSCTTLVLITIYEAGNKENCQALNMIIPELIYDWFIWFTDDDTFFHP